MTWIVTVQEDQESGVKGGNRALLLAKRKVDGIPEVRYYVASFIPVAPDTGKPETLVFESDPYGKITKWGDVAGGRGMSIEQATQHLRMVLNGEAEHGLLDNPMFEGGVVGGLLNAIGLIANGPGDDYYVDEDDES